MIREILLSSIALMVSITSLSAYSSPDKIIPEPVEYSVSDGFYNMKGFQSVFFRIYHSLDACLDNQFGTLDARRGCDVERRAIAVVRTLCNLRNCISLGMQDVGLSLSHIILANILEARGCTIITIRDNHLILHKQRSDLATHAV